MSLGRNGGNRAASLPYVTIPPDVTFRAKLLLILAVAVVVSVGLVAWGVSVNTQRAFEQFDAQRSAALVEQFRREFAARRDDVERRVVGIADAEATLRMALDLSRPDPDYAVYVSDAYGLARNYQLDFVEMVTHEGIIFSSSHRPAKFLHANDWVRPGVDWKAEGAFLRREDFSAPERRESGFGTPVGSTGSGSTREGIEEGATRPALVLAAVRQVGVGEKKLYIIGGRKLDESFLASLVLPAGMRALLYRNLEPQFSPALLTGTTGPLDQADKLAALIERVRQSAGEATETITWSADPATAETFHAIPLTGRTEASRVARALAPENDLLAVLLVGSSRRQLVEVQGFTRRIALVAGAVGVLAAVLLSWWAAARVTRPVEQLAGAARDVAAGKWDVAVAPGTRDEVGELARAFNQMTRQLTEQRERLLAAERVAAWRELARRLAHELKNPLHPLQITIENLQRARDAGPAQFDEVFRESTGTLLAELENLKTIVNRFSDFAKMPRPQFQPVHLNELARNAVRLFDGLFAAPGRPHIVPEFYFDESLGPIQADPDLLHRAVQNLVLNAVDAMPTGGTLAIRTRARAEGALLEVSDTGAGLTPEECQRLFTPYYTSKHHGTGLGLAIVQSVVSDHGGRVSVESEPARGTTIRIELPASPPAPAVTPGAICETAPVLKSSF